MARSLIDLYEIKDSGTVTLSITIVEGQTGSTSVFLDGNPLAQGEVGNVEIVLPLEGAELRRKKLLCSSIVVDKLGPPNRTSLTYALKGGVLDREWSNSEQVARDGETTWHTAEFFMFEIHDSKRSRICIATATTEPEKYLGQSHAGCRRWPYHCC